MKMNDDAGIDLDAYLARVGLAQVPPLSAEGLEAIHRAQVFTIPFENFDIMLGRALDLSPAGLMRKLVGARRGGYCFEVNQLLRLALAQLGFSVRPLLGRVQRWPEPTGRQHLITLVEVGGRAWIADVGFGANGLRAPIPLELDRIAEQDGYRYRLVDGAPYGILLQLETPTGWQNLYSFDLETVCAADIALGNFWTECHPHSYFTQARIASLPTPTGRVSLHNFTLRRVTGHTGGEHELAPGDPYLAALAAHFGIHLDVPYTALRDLPPVT